VIDGNGGGCNGGGDGHNGQRQTEEDAGDTPLVLDASVLLEGMALPQGMRCLVTPSVVDEVSKGGPGRTMEGMLAAGLEVRSPGPKAVVRVEEAARRSGDHRRLSRADVDSLALALELGALLVTDDYSMQNTASGLGIPWRGHLQSGIREELKWKLKCRGCARTFGDDETGASDECPICGSPLRQVPAGKGRRGS
jgi:UPF0271 protein